MLTTVPRLIFVRPFTLHAPWITNTEASFTPRRSLHGFDTVQVMEKPSPSMRDLARRLVTLEAASPTATDAPAHEVSQVCAKLGIALTRFAGPDGFTALLRRALALARTDVALLQSVKLTADGRLEGLDQAGTEAALAIITNLLGLLATFIGDPLMLRLVREAWPDTSLDE